MVSGSSVKGEDDERPSTSSSSEENENGVSLLWLVGVPLALLLVGSAVGVLICCVSKSLCFAEKTAALSNSSTIAPAQHVKLHDDLWTGPTKYTGPFTVYHVTDTHGLEHDIDKLFGLNHLKSTGKPVLLLHSGDFTNFGSRKEAASFVGWLELLLEGGYIERALVTPGNHDWDQYFSPLKENFIQKAVLRAVSTGEDIAEIVGEYWRTLFNELVKEEHRGKIRLVLDETVLHRGVNIHLSSWQPWWDHDASAATKDKNGAGIHSLWRAMVEKGLDKKFGGLHRYHKIPKEVDILVTHNPAWGVLNVDTPLAELGDDYNPGPWGGCTELRFILEGKRHVKRVGAHFHGHLHEDRGVLVLPKPRGS